MADIKFDQFNNPTLAAGDFLVGYNADGSLNIRVTVSALAATISSILGLGNAATKNVGTAAGTVAAGDDSRIVNAVQEGAITGSGLTQTTGKLLGRSTAADGAIEEITVGSGLSMAAGVLTASGGATGAVQTGNSSVTIPALQSSPDATHSGSQVGEDFNQNTSGVPSGWTSIPSGALNTVNTTAAYSQLYAKCPVSGGGTVELAGIYRAISGACTITGKLSDYSVNNDLASAGFGIGESGASGKFELMEGFSPNGGFRWGVRMRPYNSRTSGGSPVSATGLGSGTSSIPLYFKIVIASATDVSYYYSYTGLLWTPMPSSCINRNPGFTPAAVVIGLNSADTGNAVEAMFDWINVA